MADPYYDDIDLAKEKLQSCIHGTLKTQKMEGGTVFSGDNIDIDCIFGMEGISPNADPFDYFIFEGNRFWFFSQDGASGTTVRKTKKGVLVTHSHATRAWNYLIRDFSAYANADTIPSERLGDGAFEFEDDYYDRSWVKHYLPEDYGVMWFSARYDYDGNIKQLLDIYFKSASGAGDCMNADEILKKSGYTKEQIDEQIDEDGKTNFWLAALTMSEREKWCY